MRRSLPWLMLGLALFLLPAKALAVGVQFSAVGSTDPLTEVLLEPGGTTTIAVTATEVPEPGLAAFQLDVLFDAQVANLFNPNEDFRGTIAAFAPLGDNPFCDTVRDETPCPDPGWFIASTGRTPIGTDEIDNASGRISIAYGTAGADSPPTGDGTIALIDVAGLGLGTTVLRLASVILGDNSEPPESFPVTTTNLSVTVVPEPSTGALLAFGIFMATLSQRPARARRGSPRS